MAAGRAHRSNAGAKMAGLLDKEVGCLKVLINRFKILKKNTANHILELCISIGGG